MLTKTSETGQETAIKPEPNLLLRSLRLSNFLSFGPNVTEIEFGPLTVLIGANGAGKSNLIEAIGLLRSCPVPVSARGSGNIQSIVSKGGGADEWIWKGKPGIPAFLRAFISNKSGKMPLNHFFVFASEQQRFRLRDEGILAAYPETEPKDAEIYYSYLNK